MSRIAPRDYFRTCVNCMHDRDEHARFMAGATAAKMAFGTDGKEPIDQQYCRAPGCQCTDHRPVAYQK